jgi:selenocysteine-specific elongation factor
MRVDARLRLLADAPPLRHGARVRVHHGTSEIAGRVSLAATRPSPGAGWVGAPPGEARVTVPPGGEAFVRLRLERPAAVTRGDRLVLRAWSPVMTVAGAEVLDPEPPAGRLRRPAALDRFRTLDAADSATAVDLLLRETDGMGLEQAALVRRAGLGIAEAAAAVRAGDRVAAGSRVFGAAAVARLAATVERTLAAFHAEHPHETGLPRETLRTRMAPAAAPELFDLVMQRLADARRLAGTDRVALAGHAPAASDDDRRVRDAIDERLRAAGLMPPDAGQLRAALDAPASVVDRILNAMVREKALTRLGTLVFHAAALEALKAEIRAGRDAPGGGTVDVGTFKQHYGLSRKFAIPLLEWLDRERVTRRAGERRIVL